MTQSEAHRPNFYAGPFLDRRGNQRRDDAWLSRSLASAETRIIPLWRDHNLFTPSQDTLGDDPPSPRFLTRDEWAKVESQADSPIYLGFHEERHFFAADLSRAEDPPLAALGEFTDLRQTGPLLPRFEGSILAYARGLVYWHSQHGYCGVCSARTRLVDGGHVRRCNNESCGAMHFPRTDPAIIVLVTHGDSVLVGRSPRWPVGTYSALAGFVEPGESLEMAVAREVQEEVGLRLPLGAIRYNSSQPWPFPASIMLGFFAAADDTALTLDKNEIEDAIWVHRRDLRDASDGSFRLPRADSIARRLITDWLAGH